MMKKIVSIVLCTIITISMSIAAFALQPYVYTTDNNSQYGVLIYSQETDNGDGTVTKENLYKKESEQLIQPFAQKTYGTDTFTKVSTVSLEGKPATVLCEYQVTATFDWDSKDKTVSVYNEEGEITQKDCAEYLNEKTTTKGDGSRKASATFSFNRKTRWGFNNKHSVKVSCNYKGRNS